MYATRLRPPQESIVFDGVPEALQELRDLHWQGEPGHINADPVLAIEYGRSIAPRLAHVLGVKLDNLELAKRVGTAQMYERYSHIKLLNPQIIWGVWGIDRVAGAIAAEQAIARNAEGLELEMALDFPVHPTNKTLTWTRLSVTNPEFQPGNIPRVPEPVQTA